MTEAVEYTVLTNIDDVEIRSYPKLILATVNGATDDVAFSVLFRYISGGNRPKSKIAMTAPVISQGGNQQIAMTTPVISDESSFSFVMPSDYTIDTVPEPVDDRIRITEVAERTLAVITFRGRASVREFKQHNDRLVELLNASGILAKGRPFLMRYNSPFTPGFLRRNEVGVEIEGTPRKIPGG